MARRACSLTGDKSVGALTNTAHRSMSMSDLSNSCPPWTNKTQAPNQPVREPSTSSIAGKITSDGEQRHNTIKSSDTVLVLDNDDKSTASGRERDFTTASKCQPKTVDETSEPELQIVSIKALRFPVAQPVATSEAKHGAKRNSKPRPEELKRPKPITTQLQAKATDPHTTSLQTKSKPARPSVGKRGANSPLGNENKRLKANAIDPATKASTPSSKFATKRNAERELSTSYVAEPPTVVRSFSVTKRSYSHVQQQSPAPTTSQASRIPSEPRSKMWSSAQFSDMVGMAYESFPFSAFAEKHHKSVAEVQEIFSGVVMVPIVQWSSRAIERARARMANEAKDEASKGPGVERMREYYKLVDGKSHLA